MSTPEIILKCDDIFAYNEIFYFLIISSLYGDSTGL